MHMLHQRVESLSTAPLLLYSLPRDSDSNSMRQVANSLSPDELVEFRIDSNVLSVHHFVH